VDLKELLLQADLALSREAPAAERIAHIESFVAAVSSWFEEHGQEPGAGLGKEQAEQMRLLRDKHELVMAEVAALMQDTSAEMRKLHKKAKAIMAYGGKQLGRISVGREKKG